MGHNANKRDSITAQTEAHKLSLYDCNTLLQKHHHGFLKTVTTIHRWSNSYPGWSEICNVPTAWVAQISNNGSNILPTLGTVVYFVCGYILIMRFFLLFVHIYISFFPLSRIPPVEEPNLHGFFPALHRHWTTIGEEEPRVMIYRLLQVPVNGVNMLWKLWLDIYIS